MTSSRLGFTCFSAPRPYRAAARKRLSRCESEIDCAHGSKVGDEMVSRLGVINVGGDAGGDIITGLKSNALSVQAVNQPLERIQRMTEHGTTGAALNYFSIDAQFDRLIR